MRRVLAIVGVALLATPLCAYGIALYVYAIWYYTIGR